MTIAPAQILPRESSFGASFAKPAIHVAATPDDEMAPGDEAPLGSPATGEDVCPDCGGSGKVDGKACTTCDGRGKVIAGIGGA